MWRNHFAILCNKQLKYHDYITPGIFSLDEQIAARNARLFPRNISADIRTKIFLKSPPIVDDPLTIVVLAVDGWLSIELIIIGIRRCSVDRVIVVIIARDVVIVNWL